MERRANAWGRENFDSLRENLIQRLLRVCGHMTREELHRLTAQMVRLQLKYARDTAVPRG